MARPAGEINAGSMADIAFLLLIFFLVTTTMDVETGIQRRLPPMPDENQQTEVEQINKRNIMVVLINQSDRLFAGGQEMHITMLKDKVKEFIVNPANLPNLPENVKKHRRLWPHHGFPCRCISAKRPRYFLRCLYPGSKRTGQSI